MSEQGTLTQRLRRLKETEERLKRAEKTLAKLVDARGKDSVKSLETQIAEWKVFHKIIKDYEEERDAA